MSSWDEAEDPIEHLKAAAEQLKKRSALFRKEGPQYVFPRWLLEDLGFDLENLPKGWHVLAEPTLENERALAKLLEEL